MIRIYFSDRDVNEIFIDIGKVLNDGKKCMESETVEAAHEEYGRHLFRIYGIIIEGCRGGISESVSSR